MKVRTEFPFGNLEDRDKFTDKSAVRKLILEETSQGPVSRFSYKDDKKF
jgi:hypothetical protein